MATRYKKMLKYANAGNTLATDIEAIMPKISDLVIVGIDLGFLSLGVVAMYNLDPSQCWAKTLHPYRTAGAVRIYDYIRQFDELFEDGDYLFAIEGGSYSSRGYKYQLGELSGAIKGYLMQRGFSFITIPPSSSKYLFTGNGRSTKETMIYTARALYGHEMSEHEADAFALCVSTLKIMGLLPVEEKDKKALNKILRSKGGHCICQIQELGF